MYMVDAAAAQKLVPEAFDVVEAAPGMTQCTLVIVDYRDNDLGDYDEVGVVFFVRPAGQSDAELGSYIYKLPVNQSFGNLFERDARQAHRLDSLCCTGTDDPIDWSDVVPNPM